MATTFTHRGPWNETSRKSPVLRFIENYLLKVDSKDRANTPSSNYFSDLAVYHDTKGQDHVTGPHIWEFISRQLSPFSSVRNEVVEIRVVQEEPLSPPKYIVYAEFVSYFRVRGDEEDILVPRFFNITLGEAEDKAGSEGLQIQELKLFMDTGIIGRYVTEKKRREARKRHVELEIEVHSPSQI